MTPDMVFILGGAFLMSDNFAEGYSHELRVHLVTLDLFYMGRYEVASGQYCEYLNSALGQGLITVISGVVYKAGSGASYPCWNASSVGGGTRYPTMVCVS